VATNGDNLNNGTNALTPFRTITKALATAVDGTRIHIAAGSYTNGSETFPLTLTGKIGVQLLAPIVMRPSSTRREPDSAY